MLVFLLMAVAVAVAAAFQIFVLGSVNPVVLVAIALIIAFAGALATRRSGDYRERP